MSFGGECAGPLASCLQPLSLQLPHEHATTSPASSWPSTSPCPGIVLALHLPTSTAKPMAEPPELLLHVDTSVPDGAIVDTAGALIGTSSNSNLILARLWGDASARCTVSTVMCPQLPLVPSASTAAAAAASSSSSHVPAVEQVCAYSDNI